MLSCLENRMLEILSQCIRKYLKVSKLLKSWDYLLFFFDAMSRKMNVHASQM